MKLLPLTLKAFEAPKPIQDYYDEPLERVTIQCLKGSIKFGPFHIKPNLGLVTLRTSHIGELEILSLETSSEVALLLE